MADLSLLFDSKRSRFYTSEITLVSQLMWLLPSPLHVQSSFFASPRCSNSEKAPPITS